MLDIFHGWFALVPLFLLPHKFIRKNIFHSVIITFPWLDLNANLTYWQRLFFFSFSLLFSIFCVLCLQWTKVRPFAKLKLTMFYAYMDIKINLPCSLLTSVTSPAPASFFAFIHGNQRWTMNINIEHMIILTKLKKRRKTFHELMLCVQRFLYLFSMMNVYFK